MSQPPIAIVIHGGAGTITRAAMTPALEKDYRDKLAETLEAGYAVLKADGRALDAVQAAVEVMEDSPLFNAGRGAVFSRGGGNRLDASIMDGATLDAGAVGADHLRQLDPMHPHAQQAVVPVQRCGLQLDDHPLGRGVRVRPVLQAQHVRAAE